MSVALEKFDTLDGYRDLRRWLDDLKTRKQVSTWADAVRWYCCNDLFFLMTDVLSDGAVLNSQTGKPLFFHPDYLRWARGIEWQAANGGGADFSARRTGKSTWRTKARNIQRMIASPDSAGVIFSVMRKYAVKHFRVVKEELENNRVLRTVFDDILYDDPKTAAKNGETVWSMDAGLRVKRSVTRKEQSLEYNAFFDGTPVGGGYEEIHLDDVEEHVVVSSEEMINKLHASYESILNLQTPMVWKRTNVFFTNTFYSDRGLAQRIYDSWRSVDERKVHIRPGEDLSRPGPGPLGGTPVYPYTEDSLKARYTPENPKEYSIQICCSFRAGENRLLKPEHVAFYEMDPDEWGRNKNIYVCIDPSRGVEDPTVMWVWALGADRKAAWVDVTVKKLDPATPAFVDEVFRIVAKWSAFGRLVEVRVEDFGQSDYAGLIRNELQRRYRCFATVVRCIASGQKFEKLFATGKRNREFERWATPLARGEVLAPKPINQGGPGLLREDETGKQRDWVHYFLSAELAKFPFPKTDNLLDAGALLWEPPDGRTIMPLQYPAPEYGNRSPTHYGRRGATWMSA